MENPELYFPELSPIENNLLGQNYSVDDGEAVLVITLNIGDGRQDEIKVYEHDDSDQLALDFCHKHKLGARAKILLADEIEKYLKIALSRSAAHNSSSSSRHSISQSSPNRPRRNQTFTQKSMQVKQILRSPQVRSPTKNSVNEVEKKRVSNQAMKSQNTTVVYQPSVQNHTRNNRRANSMYENPRGALEEGKFGFACSKSVWIPDSSPLNSSTAYSPRKSEESETKKNDRSERLMKKIKYQRYKEIFEILSPNTKGVITPETVRKFSIPSLIGKLLQPLLEELEELNETLDFNEFYDAMEMLMKALTPGDKSALLLPSKSKQVQVENYEFKPKTNVGKVNTGNMSMSSLYDRGLQRKTDFSRRVEKEREVIKEAEMKECKFVPSITSHKRSLSSKSFKS